jgi:hypothetical protein
MQPFTTTTLLTKKDYTKYLYREVYKKPYYIFVTVLGVYLVIISIRDAIAAKYDGGVFMMELVGGFFALVVPVINVHRARKTTFAKLSLQHAVTYTFSDDSVAVKGFSFETVHSWQHVTKVKEADDFLLLYTSEKVAYFIKKDGLTGQQVSFIQSKVAAT